MKNPVALITLTLITNLTSIASAVGAAILAYHDKKGWGWFLLVAVLTNATPKFNDSDKKEKKKEDNTNLILG